MGKKVYPIPPDRSLMEKIGATSFTLAEAIVELVANSIDARLLDPAGLAPHAVNVDILVLPGEVRVIDDAAGMTEEVLVAAVRLGVQMDAILGSRKRKGMYGLGLKTAAGSIGRYWAVHTRPHGGNEDYFLEFDLEAFASASSGTSADWTVEVQSLKRTKSSVLGDREHGTAVVIRKLRDSNPMAGPVLQLLGDAYKPHLASGDVIRVNGDEAQATEYDFGDSRVELDEVVDGKRGWVLKGWVAIDSKTHNDGTYGFNLYRENQLIETWDKSWFRAHLMTSRIIGEAHIDFMPVNFNKQGFKTQSEEWRTTLEFMKERLRPVVKASNDSSRGRSDEFKYKRAVAGMKKALNVNLGDADMDSASGASGSPTAGPSGGSAPPPDFVALRELRVAGRLIIPTALHERWDSDVTPWDYVHEEFDEGARIEVQTVLNTASTLFQRTTDQHILGILAIADCVTRYLVERHSIPPAKAREVRDRWIFEAVAAAQPAASGAK